MADDFTRECLSAGPADDGTIGVLVVSSDKDKQEFRSDLFEFNDFLAGKPRLVFTEDEWLSSMWRSPGGHYYMCEILGHCYTNSSGRFLSQRVTKSHLFRIWGLHDRAVYVVGANGACFRFDGTGWLPFGDGLVGDIHDISAASEDSLYCVGQDGFVARRIGAAWQPLQMETNASFTCVHVEPDGSVLVGAANGLCFRIVNDDIQELDAPPAYYHSITRWRGSVYFGSLAGGVFKLEGDTLSSIKATVGGNDAKPSSDFMWTCGGPKLIRFDGIEWRSRIFS